MRKRIISLGWGRQSFALAAMAALGEIPPVDLALHADTTFEHQGTYAFAQRWAGWLGAHGVPVVTVRPVEPSIFNKNGGVLLPVYTGHFAVRGQFHRQCTDRWKIGPMRRLMVKSRKDGVDLLIGISKDEFKRMKPSNRKYLNHQWPLIDLGLTRTDCEKWLESKGLEVPPKSSCVFCPYQKRSYWQVMAGQGGADWSRAVEVDELVRKARPPDDLFIYPDRVPLVELAGRPAAVDGEDLFEDECTGICGV
jgi:hypothetical protein